MKGGDRRRQRVDVGGREFASGEERGGEGVLRKLAHLHRVLERGAVAAEDRGVDAAGDRHDVQVERRREAAVEPQFFFAEEAPRREGREIEEAEVDRLLDLVGVPPVSST